MLARADAALDAPLAVETRINLDPNAPRIATKALPPGLAIPSAKAPSVVASAIVALNGAPLLRLSGTAWDAELLVALTHQWRSLKADLAKLSPGDTERLSSGVVRALNVRGYARDDAEKRLAAYTVRLVVERATARQKASAPVAAPVPASAAPPQLSQTERDARALEARGIVDRRVRYLMAHDPQKLPSYLGELAESKLSVARLPVSFRDGWVVAVHQGKVVGTADAKAPFASPAVHGQHYRFGLHDIATGRLIVGPRPVEVTYEFADVTRTMSAVAYAQTLIAQQAFLTQAAWPKAGDPFDLATVRDYIQRLCDSGMTAPEVFAHWHAYLSAFYVHANSADLQGTVGAGGAALYDTARLTNDMQGVVRDLLPATTGQRLLDCEFFAGLTHDIFGRITTKEGAPRFDVYWVALDTHEAALIVARGSGRRAVALSNNDAIDAQWTTASGVGADVLTHVGEHIFWGAGAVFALDADHDAADNADHNSIDVPTRDSYIYDGKTVARVTDVDRRAFLIFAATREHLTDTKHRDFVASWKR